jgi:MFS family permease
LIKNVDFWAIVLTFSMIMHCNGAVLTNMVPMARDRGLTAMEGAMVLSLSAGMAVLGKLVFGWIADHIDTRIAVWISIAFQFMGAIFFLQEDSILMMRIAGASFGFGMGGVVPLWGSLIGEVFGRENFGTIMGSMSPCMVPISMTGLPLAAYIFDVTGSYTIAFRMHLVIYVIAALCMFLLKRRDVDQRIKRGITPTHTYEEE